MRYLAILAMLVAVLLTASWLAPMAHMPARNAAAPFVAPEAIVTASLAGTLVGPMAGTLQGTLAGAMAVADWQVVPSRLEAGRATLVYNVMPARITQPILPDIPEPIAELTPDRAPLMPTDITMLSWMGQAPPPDLFQVTAQSLNIRSAPRSSATVVASLEQGGQAVVTGAAQSGWVPVRTVKGRVEGWAFKRYLMPVGG